MVGLNMKGDPSNIVRAQVRASASFLISVYFCSVGDMAREMYATWRRSPDGCFRRSTAPSPYEEASADTIVSNWELYRASMGLSVKAVLMLPSAEAPSTKNYSWI